MTKILGFSGKKQAGKNSAANQLIARELRALQIVKGSVAVTPEGKIQITDLLGQEDSAGILASERVDDAMYNFKAHYLDPYIKCYSFADTLKQDVCVNVLGLTREQCYGTDEQKNSATHLKWEDMPGVATADVWNTIDGKKTLDSLGMTYHAPGTMTAREVMQYVGTEVFRKMYHNVWADATIRRIEIEQPLVALITDCRFPNEVEAIQKAGGKVMRLTRDIYEGQDQHPSETALDKDEFDWSKFDWVIDNHKMNLLEQMNAVGEALVEAGWIDAPENLTE